MKKHRVYINQVNQTFIDVEARNEESAITKAEKQWSEENGPSVMSVCLIKHEVTP